MEVDNEATTVYPASLSYNLHFQTVASSMTINNQVTDTSSIETTGKERMGDVYTSVAKTTTPPNCIESM